MPLHLIDGTYELFRAHFALPSLKAPDGREVGAARGLAQTLLLLLPQPAIGKTDGRRFPFPKGTG